MRFTARVVVAAALVAIAVPAGFLACAKGVSSEPPPEGGVFTVGDGAASGGDDGSAAGSDADLGNASPAGPGDLVLSEVMFHPSGPEPQQEWVEVYNTTSEAKSLSGVALVDGVGRSHTIGALAVPPQGYVILVHDRTGAMSAALPGASTAYEYGAGDGGPLLGNSGTSSIALKKGGTTLVSVPYGGFGIGSLGASIQLKTLTAQASGSASSWCESLHPWPGGGDKGTPVAANDCP